MSLSKSRFIAGLQCHRRLWWEVHEPDAAELVPDPVSAFRTEQGQRIGELARGRFPGGRLIELPRAESRARIAATRAALDAGVPAIFEATFGADDVVVRVDVLQQSRDRFALIEVKSSTRVKDEHLPDVAVQLHVLRRSGLDVTRADVMHVNRECRHPSLDDLFARADVTVEAEDLQPVVLDEIAAQLAMLEGPLPSVPIGAHCTSPRKCPFINRCWKEVPAHHVTTLFGFGKRAWQLARQGLETIHDLPAGLKLSPVAARQRLAVQQARLVVEPELAAVLDHFQAPLAFLDFETIAPAAPAFPGCHPYDPVPVQFSLHVATGDGAFAHHEWLATAGTDPRPELAARLVAACSGTGSILAYNAPFEKRCLRHLAEAVPALAGALGEIEARAVDLLPVVRRHVYHPFFHGSFSLKTVLPALVPAVGYGELAIADGDIASVWLYRLLLQEHTIPENERGQLRKDLLAYCRTDTWALVKLLERLRDLSA